MVPFWAQLRLLLWKEFLVKRRQKVWLFVEISVPIVLFALLALIRTRNFEEISPQCHYDAKFLPSAGVLPFAQSLLCTLPNRCHNGGPTTGDETFEVNTEHAGEQSLLVKVLRWTADLLGVVGQRPAEWGSLLADVAQLLHELSQRGQMPHRQLAFPVSLLFANQSAMDAALDSLGYNSSVARFFQHISFSPELAQTAFQQMSNVPNTVSGSLLDLLGGGDSGSFLCGRGLTTPGLFTSPNGEHLQVDLCQVRPSDLIMLHLAHPEYFNFTRSVQEVLKQTLDAYLPGNSIDSASLTRGLLFAHAQMAKLPPIGFGQLNSSTALFGALFCNSLFATFDQVLSNSNNNSGSSTGRLDPIFREISVDILAFIRHLMETKEGGQPVGPDPAKCGQIPTEEKDSTCRNVFLRLPPQARPLLRGRILVSPDAPVVRQLVSELSGPLEETQLLFESVDRFNSLARPLQDALAESDLPTAAKNLLTVMEDLSLPLNFTLLTHSSDHLFANSSDPDSLLPRIENLTKLFSEYAKCFRTDRFAIVADEQDLEQLGHCLSERDEYFTGVHFLNLSSEATVLPSSVTYKIRHLPSLVDSTNSLADGPRNVLSRDRPFIDLKYVTFGFVFLQEAIDRALIRAISGRMVQTGVQVQQEPFPCVKRDTFNVSAFLALFVVLSWMVPCSLLVKSIVWEKEQRLKEMMRIMGLGDAVHWVAWGCRALTLNALSALSICALLKFGDILPRVDFSLLFSLLLLFAAACICQCIFWAALFSRANIASVCVSLLQFLLFAPFQFSIRSKSPTISHISLLLPQTAIGFAMTMGSAAEDAGDFRWATIEAIRLDDQHLSLARVLLALAVDCLVYLSLAAYISAVFPGQFGVGRRWYFLLTRDFWFPPKPMEKPVPVREQLPSPQQPQRPFTAPAKMMGRQPIGGASRAQAENGTTQQRVADLGEKAVAIVALSKVHQNGTKALDGLSVDFHADEISALLGHNGAGKSTTISILTGLYPASGGSAFVFGMDTGTQMAAIRQCLGFCPQHNILFEDLSVEEQLTFYGTLKGITQPRLGEHIDALLAEIGLSEKRTELANTLSGGMKRKLCIGVALIGGSRLVVLDEPTAGIDSHARKAIWQLLLKHRTGRSILLCSHHMDEVDVLADRIAILAEGRLRAQGTPLSLKRTYGDGYKLSLALNRNQNSAEDGKVERGVALEQFIRQMASENGLELVNDSSYELVLRLPVDLPPHKLAALLGQMEAAKHGLGISSFGITAPSLQQVFLKIAPLRDSKLKKAPLADASCLRRALRLFQRRNYLVADGEPVNIELAQRKKQELNSAESMCDRPRESPHTGLRLQLHHTKALLAKRTQIAKRSKAALFAELFLPLLVLFSAELYRKSQTQTMAGLSPNASREVISQRPLVLNPSVYRDPLDFYFANWNRSLPGEHLGQIAPSAHRVRCVDPDIRALLQYSPFDDSNRACGDSAGADLSPEEESGAAQVPYNSLGNLTCPYCLAEDELGGGRCERGQQHQQQYPIDQLPKLRASPMDTFRNLSGRNISEFRMSVGQRVLTLGGWTVGHRNAYGRSPAQLADEHRGLDTLAEALAKMAGTLQLNWTAAVASANLSSVSNNMTQMQLAHNLIDSADATEIVKVWFNNKQWASLPINLNLYSNALLHSLLRNSSLSGETVKLTAVSHPMSQTLDEMMGSSPAIEQRAALFRVVLLMLALCVICANFCLFAVEETSSRCKQLQLTFGLHPALYLLANSAFDLALYLCCMALLFPLYWFVDVGFFSFSSDAFSASLLLLLAFGCASIPLVHLLARLFSVPSLAFVLIGGGTFFVGIVSTMVVLVLENFPLLDDPALDVAHRVCSVLFLLLLPQYCLGMAVSRLQLLYVFYKVGLTQLVSISRPELASQLPIPSPLHWDLLGKYIVAMGAQALVFWLILLFVEFRTRLGIFRMLERKKLAKLAAVDTEWVEDADVQSEKKLVQGMANPKDFGILVKGISKSYNGTSLAVNDLSLAIARGECFGLLGVNGAGKSTTFAMLAGTLPTGLGEVFIDGISATVSPGDAYRQLGHCPQFDAFAEKLTVRENLAFFARIPGVREEDIGTAVGWAMGCLGLRCYADERADSLSGGNRRKLSTAIALVGSPPVVLLDEPSAGMDPQSQQFMWRLIQRLRQSNRTVVLTSHSMEECEQLCTRIGLMARGRLHGIGSVQHLKQRFGKGHTLVLKLMQANDAQNVQKLVSDRLPAAKLHSVCFTTVVYTLPNGECSSLSDAFNAICEIQSKVHLEDYSLSQATLDDLFVAFAERFDKPAQNPD